MEFLASLMDDRWSLPGTRIRLGLDALLGLIPGIGDLAGGAISAYLMAQAHRAGAPRRILWRMAGNVIVDTLLGSVPLLGDLFDVGFRANRRNLRLLQRHLNRHPPTR